MMVGEDGDQTVEKRAEKENSNRPSGSNHDQNVAIEYLTSYSAN